MMRMMLLNKIHRAMVTETNIDYQGSITIDKTLMEAVELLPFEKVHVLDVDNGARLETYAIEGPPDSGVICLNGAAARLVARGDRVIILSYALMSEEEARHHRPKMVLVDNRNRITEKVAVKTS